MLGDKVKITGTEILADDRYTLKKITYEYLRNEGKPVVQSREVYDRGNAAAILLYNPQQRSVVLTRQFRLPVFINDNTSGILIEACAGLLDNDSPEDCVRREAEEETGYKIKAAQKIFSAYMSPGSLTEIVHFFVAEYDNTMKTREGGGLESEQEYIEVLEMSFDKAMSMIDTGEIRDAKTIMLLQFAKLNNLV